jgi:hypothetical protein
MSTDKTKEEKPPQFDDVLRRMLSSPPDPKVKAKPADKKPAKNRVKKPSCAGLFRAYD